MKKILFTFFIAFVSFATKAQLGLTVGGNLAQYKYTSDRKPIIAFNAGLSFKSSLGNAVYIVPELLYTSKGAQVYPVITTTSSVMKYRNHLNYLQFNLPVMWSAEVADDLNFDFGIGPFMSYLVSAKNNAENFDGTKSSRNFAIGSELTDDFKAFDYGTTFSIGFTVFKKIGWHIKYDLGLANLSPQPNYPALKTRNVSFNLTVGLGN